MIIAFRGFLWLVFQVGMCMYSTISLGRFAVILHGTHVALCLMGTVSVNSLGNCSHGFVKLGGGAYGTNANQYPDLLQPMELRRHLES